MLNDKEAKMFCLKGSIKVLNNRAKLCNAFESKTKNNFLACGCCTYSRGLNEDQSVSADVLKELEEMKEYRTMFIDTKNPKEVNSFVKIV